MTPEHVEILLAALRGAQEDTCSLHCPSVKRTGEEWTHVERCQVVSAAIAAVEAALTTPAKTSLLTPAVVPENIDLDRPFVNLRKPAGMA